MMAATFTPGETVFIVSYGSGLERISLPVKVDRVLQRTIVLANGQRFNANTLHAVGDGPYSGSRLVKADDPAVQRLQREEFVRTAQAKVHLAAAAFDREPTLANIDRLRTAANFAEAIVAGGTNTSAVAS
jgi:hypothetical protein